MAIVDTRQKLIDYCKRKLGDPVIKINVPDVQLDDRIDDALQYFAEFHFDGVERVFLKHQITQDDIDKREIPIDNPAIIAIRDIVAVPQSQFNIFDVRYQVMLNDFYNFNNVSMIHYQIARQHLALLDFLFNVKPTLRFNRKKDTLNVDMDWHNVKVGDFMIFDCDAILDPEDFPKVYNDRWLKEYATALIKRQWGSNLSKYNGIQLPGGVTLDGVTIKQEAEEDIRRLEEEAQNTYQLPISFIMG